jgi:diacylglycerol kinase (ATP)
VSTKTRVIVNPMSAHGATGRRWSEIESLLRTTLGEFEVQRTLGRRDAERIAVEAVHDGAQRIVVAGGDGTASEVVSGLLHAGLADEVQVGLLPLGTGRDLPRTLGIASDLPRAVESLGIGSTRQIDAMRVTYRDAAGAERSAYSMNVTSFGLSGLTVELVGNALSPVTSSFPLAGSLAFLVGAIGAIIRHRCEHLCIRADGVKVCDEPFVLAALANGRYFGGGMQIAPDASPDDGMLDLVIVREMSKARLIASLPSLYRGTHVANPAVSVHRVTRVEAVPRSDAQRIPIDVDGEGLGTLPLRAEVVPRAVTIFGVDSSGPRTRT